MTRLFDRFTLVARLTLVIGLQFAVTLPLTAQTSTGRIVGRIVDAESGRGISDAGIQVVGTTMGAVSGVDGRYSLPSIRAGTVTLHVRLLGYQPKTVTGLQLDAGATLEQDITLSPATVQLETQVVTADVERGSVNAALDAQRNATGIMNSITSEQIQRSPDADAAQAVQRVSGVTVQDGKYVYVRGLGERYTTASLNGARIPSPEPEKRLVPLDLFPAGLLQTVTTSKTFTPDQPGDFSGASLEIKTREFPAQREISYSASIGYNARATGKSILGAPRTGMEWVGFAGDERAWPASIAATRGTIFYREGPETNRLVSSFRNAWSAKTVEGAPNTSFSAALGGSDAVFGRTLGYVASLSYSFNQEMRADEVRGIAQGASGNGGAIPLAEWRGSTGRASVQWGGLANVSTLLGGSSRIAFNNTYTRNGDNEARFEEGTVEEFAERRTVLRYIERSVRSNQLLGQHQLGARNALDWSVTSSGVTRYEPDRSTVLFRRLTSDPPGTPYRLESGRGGAERAFLDLDESNLNIAANYRFEFGDVGRAHFVKVGGSWRQTDRTADNFAYQIFENLPVSALELPPEEIFDGRFAGPGDSVFSMEGVARAGSYTADDRVAAGYGMIELAVNDRIRIVGGARVEAGDLEVITELTGGESSLSQVKKTDVLPSLALNVRVGETHNVRLSGSQTLSRPEYRELSDVDVNDGAQIGVRFRGNPDLRRTLIQNADARWEWYPNPGEVLSLGVFYKRFTDPIERIEVNVSGLRESAQQTVINAEGADNYGIEVDFRKRLGFLGGAFDGFVLSTNATLMESEIDIGSQAVGTMTSTKRAMVGQSPYVVNAGLTYFSPSARGSATVLFNSIGRRVVAASVAPLPDVYEEARVSLDLSFRLPVVGSLSAKFDAKNILNEPYEQRIGSVVRESYRTGRVFTLGLSWQQ